MNKYEAHLESEIETIDGKIKTDTEEAEAAEQKAKVLRDRLAVLEKKKAILLVHRESLKELEGLDVDVETSGPVASEMAPQKKAAKITKNRKTKNLPSLPEMLKSVFRDVSNKSMTSTQAADLVVEKFPEANKKSVIKTCYQLMNKGDLERLETSPITFRLASNLEENEGDDSSPTPESVKSDAEQKPKPTIRPDVLERMRSIPA